jgi:hypothetical protein
MAPSGADHNIEITATLAILSMNFYVPFLFIDLPENSFATLTPIFPGTMASD